MPMPIVQNNDRTSARLLQDLSCGPTQRLHPMGWDVIPHDWLVTPGNEMGKGSARKSTVGWSHCINSLEFDITDFGDGLAGTVQLQAQVSWFLEREGEMLITMDADLMPALMDLFDQGWLFLNLFSDQ